MNYTPKNFVCSNKSDFFFFLEIRFSVFTLKIQRRAGHSYPNLRATQVTEVLFGWI